MAEENFWKRFQTRTGWSSEELGRRLGVSGAAVSKWRAGGRPGGAAASRFVTLNGIGLDDVAEFVRDWFRENGFSDGAITQIEDSLIGTNARPFQPDVVHTVHFVRPVEPVSDFFVHFLQGLSRVLAERPQFAIRYHDTNADPFALVARLIAASPEGDAVMIVPRDLGQVESAQEQLVKAVTSRPSSPRLIFVDRTPPAGLLARLPEASYVGVNNRKVGLLAAAALSLEARTAQKEPLFVVVDGPGGLERRDAFLEALDALRPGAVTAIVSIADHGAVEVRNSIALQLSEIARTHSGPINVFAGNDETAISVCHFALGEQNGRYRVVGCDATTEMDRWVQNGTGIAVASITNDLSAPRSIEAILDAVTERVRRPLEPRLVPPSVHSRTVADPQVSALSKSAGWS